MAEIQEYYIYALRDELIGHPAVDVDDCAGETVNGVRTGWITLWPKNDRSQEWCLEWHERTGWSFGLIVDGQMPGARQTGLGLVPPAKLVAKWLAQWAARWAAGRVGADDLLKPAPRETVSVDKLLATYVTEDDDE